MKFVLLLGVLLVGASAKTWDLSSVQGDWTKSAAVEKLPNQGFKARYIQDGKELKLSLPVHKEKDVRVTDVDRLLFGIAGTPSAHEQAMSNLTMSREDTVRLVESALGPNWETMVHLPEEDLSYIESLRLAASLNEFNLLAGGSSIEKSKRGYGYYHEEADNKFPSNWDCICHGTHHRFPWSGHNDIYWGVRLLQKYSTQRNPGSYHGATDCMLCDHAELQQDTVGGFDFDCRWCCFGECVVGLDSDNGPATGASNWRLCDREWTFDSIRTDTNDAYYNYYRINDVGRCRLPRTFHCFEEVHRLCINCADYLQVIVEDADSDSNFDRGDCRFCDLVVGANPHICRNCSHSLATIEEYSLRTTDSFRQETNADGCSCTLAMEHVIKPFPYDHHESNRGYDYRGYDYRGYDYRGYDYRGYDYRGYDYREGDRHEFEGDHHEFEGDRHEGDRNFDYRFEGDRSEGDRLDYRRPYDYRG